ncbi:hypothetical protein CHLNCDRAFT_50963 [Chlorella variabilis]|uniref:Uncharacterized protein n=1 Tax=Chlorella variabilis TaxID=554065 RepID=E1Z906_CHLVA|nr:hypothetical protein CHLNCDRAFT_50963 [Chlorella variabilis]EFN57432.1 hypothetical protein CHLNCDRAFT_50963 [Chlorella variabilis]|eukprot:XP_005849534.1 hypothetical protein CHLNCDRAFT_50963 [Chlorella variabilis]
MAQAHATIATVRSLVQALQAIRTHQKLPCAVTFEAAAGLSLRFLDGGHAMQSGISLSTSVFSQFQAPASLTFFVPLSMLLDSINTVASSMPHELHLQYPGPDNSLLLTTTEDASARTSICSYAKVATLAQQDMSSLDDMWDPQEVCSQVILSAIEDLEWTGGEVEFVMRRSPMHFSLQSIKQQSLEITFPAHALDGFSCHTEEVRATFKYKHLKAAFTNVAQKELWSAKIAISSRGVLRVTHMLTLAGGAPLASLEAQPLLGTLTSQAHAPRTCIVKFVVMPYDEKGDAGFGGDDD